LRTDLTADVDAGDPRQHDVEQHQIGADGVEEAEGLGPIPSHDDAEALPLQPDGQRLHERLLVLDDENRGLRLSHDVS